MTTTSKFYYQIRYLKENGLKKIKFTKYSLIGLKYFKPAIKKSLPNSDKEFFIYINKI